MRELASALAALSLIPGAACARLPILVELFTSQGCATCNKANDLAGRMADRPGVTVITWSVDYWDYLGWKDTSAQPIFAERQRAYDQRLGLRDVYTPQVVVDGGAQGAGDKSDVVEALVRHARRRATAAPEIAMTVSGRIAVGSGRRPKGGADVWLVRYEPGEKVTEVKAGDNRGASVTQRNVVRQLVKLGAWVGRSTSYRAPAGEDGLQSLVIVQLANGGSVVAATKPAPID